MFWHCKIMVENSSRVIASHPLTIVLHRVRSAFLTTYEIHIPTNYDWLRWQSRISYVLVELVWSCHEFLVWYMSGEDIHIVRFQFCTCFAAPEVIKNLEGQYDGKLADVWSCGVLLFVLLFHCYPFERKTDPAGPAAFKLVSLLFRQWCDYELHTCPGTFYMMHWQPK